MATRFPEEEGSDEDAEEGSSESESGSEPDGKAPSQRKRRRQRRAEERDRVRQQKAAERDRRRLEKEQAKREKADRKAAKKKDTAKGKSKEEGKDEAEPERKADQAEERTKDDAERKKRGEKAGARDEGDRRPRRDSGPERGRGPRGERRKGQRSGGGLSPKRAKAALAAALPRRGKDGDGRKKPKRAKGERRPAGVLERAFTQVLAILGAVIAGVIGVIAVIVKAVARPARKAGRALERWIAAASRVVTPTRGLLIAAVGCAVLLGLSQFADYRGISIGADAYAPGIQTVAPAPEVEREELGTAHSYLMIPLAAVAIAALLIAVRTRRWQLCRLAVLLGIVAIGVSVFVDRPAGLDEGDLNERFTGVEATLLGGYWMQIFAGLGLAVSSFLLAGEIKRGGAPERARRKRTRPTPDGRERDPDESPERRKPRLPGRRRGTADTGGAGA